MEVFAAILACSSNDAFTMKSASAVQQSEWKGSGGAMTAEGLMAGYMICSHGDLLFTGPRFAHLIGRQRLRGVVSL